jgi:hypothetical protein
MAFYIAAGAFAVLQFLAENPSVRLAIEEEAALLRRRLTAKARAAWPSGPHLEFETVLQDVAAANALLARLAARPAAEAGASGGAPGAPPQRYVLSLAWRGNPRAFLKTLSLGRALAALTGDVAVDVEARPCGAHSPSAAARRARCRAAAASRARRRDGAEGGGDAAAEEEEEEGEFADAVPVRRATLQQFYSFLRPALLQLRADEAAAQASAASAAAGAGGADEMDDATCAICLDAAVDTVSPCAHAYCTDCYLRWRATARGCALCRAPLPSERGGTGAWVLAEAEEGEGAPPAAQPATAERLVAWLQALPLASV